MRRAPLLVALIATGLVLTGCGGEDTTARYVAVDIDYEDAPAELPAGETTIELVNNGEQEHNVTIEELGEDPVVETAGGETATGAVQLEPGQYTVYCSVPGHREAGMETTLTVE